VFLTTFSFVFIFALHLVILAAAADLVSQGESGKTTAPAATGQTADRHQASQLVFLTTFVFIFALHLVILAAAADLVSQGESGKTTTTTAASEPTRQNQASQPVFVTALSFIFVFSLHLVILVAAADLVSKG
jgi:hypothetical protein